jgi:predicted lipoprotein with Yx(FWY)xxD motif
MKKSTMAIIAVVVVLALAGGAFALMHKSSKSSGSSTTSTTPPKAVSRQTVNNDVVLTKTDATIGKYLTDPSGTTLYLFTDDKSGVSNCTGSCLQEWPAYIDKGATTGLPANVGVITRTDNGQKQYTYSGMPLYYFVSAQTGLSGNGVNGFEVAVPAAAAGSSSSTSSNTSSNGYSY